MTIFTGPIIKKTIHVPAHDVEVIDEDAYWHLDSYTGEYDSEEGTDWYAKVAFPTVADAQRQHHQRDLARTAESRMIHEAAAAKRAAWRKERKEQAQAYRAQEVSKKA